MKKLVLLFLVCLGVGFSQGTTSITAPFADATHSGYLRASDWVTFNAAAGGGITALTSDVTATGPGSVAALVKQAHFNVTLYGNGTNTIAASDSFIICNPTVITGTLNLPATTGSGRFIMITAVSSGQTCAIAPNGTDKLNGVNATYSIPASRNKTTLYLTDIATGSWTLAETNIAGLSGDVVIIDSTFPQAVDSGTPLSSLAPLLSPAFITPSLGAASATSLAVASCTLGTKDICDGIGTSQFMFNSWAPQKLEFAFGTSGSPITTSGPSIKISRTEQIAAATCSSNAVDNECNATLNVYSNGSATDGMQVNALGAYATGASTTQGDNVAFTAIGRTIGSGIGIGTGIFSMGRRDTNTGRALGIEARANNITATNGTYNNAGISDTQSVWASCFATTATRCGAGVSVGSADGGTSQFITGFAVTASSVATTSFDDHSSSTTSFNIAGTHTTALIVGSTAGNVDLSAIPSTTGLKIPASAGAVPTADDFIAFNTTTHAHVWGSNGTTIVGAAAATGTGTATTCTITPGATQAVTAVSAIAIPTCTGLTNASLNYTVSTALTAATGSIVNSETQIVGLSIAANTLVAGSTFHIHAGCNATTSTTPGNVTFRIRIGTTSLSGNITATVAAASNASVTTQPFTVDSWNTVRTNGAGGTIIGDISIKDDGAIATSAFANDIGSVTTATVAVDTTATKILELTAITGAASSSVTCQNAAIQLVKI